MAWIGLRFGPVVVGGAARSVPTRPWHLVAWPCCLYLGLISGFGLVGGLIGIAVGAGVAAVGLRLWRTYRCNRNALRPDPELFAAAARMAIRLRWASRFWVKAWLTVNDRTATRVLDGLVQRRILGVPDRRGRYPALVPLAGLDMCVAALAAEGGVSRG